MRNSKKNTRREKKKTIKLHLLMGEYWLEKKRSIANKTEVVTQGLEVCAALILTSKKARTMAHIDNGFFAETTTRTMIQELKKLGRKESISAILVGGDYGIPYISPTSSREIFDPIKKELTAQKISFKHNHRSYVLPYCSYTFLVFVASAYLLLRYSSFSVRSPMIYTVVYGIGHLLAHNLIQSLLATSYNVNIPISGSGSDEIIITSGDPKGDDKLSIDKKDKRFLRLLERLKEDPKDPKSEDNLKIHRVRFN